MEMNLQFFGGRGSGGESLGGSGGGESVKVEDQIDVWSYRHNKNNEPFVNSINSAASTVQKDFPELMESGTIYSIDAGKYGGIDNTNTLGYYSPDGELSINRNYTNINKMNRVYDRAVEEGYHPSRGNKDGVQAVTYHELGHAATQQLVKQGWGKDLDDAAKYVVDNAYKNAKGRGGTKKWAGKISGYAQKNNAECIAEAVADFYCNGSKARKESKAIMSELKRLAKVEPIPFS